MPTVRAPEHEATFVFEMTDALAVAAVIDAGAAHSGEDPIGASRDQIRKQLGNVNRGL